MKKLLYAKDSQEFLKIFKEGREEERKRLASLPYVEKIKILEKMQKMFKQKKEPKNDK